MTRQCKSSSSPCTPPFPLQPLASKPLKTFRNLAFQFSPPAIIEVEIEKRRPPGAHLSFQGLFFLTSIPKLFRSDTLARYRPSKSNGLDTLRRHKHTCLTQEDSVGSS